MLDACSLDELGMQAPPTAGADPSRYFVGEIDTAVTDLSDLDGAAQPSGLALGYFGDGMIAPHAPVVPPPLRANASWESFPSIPEHAELQLQVETSADARPGLGGVSFSAPPPPQALLPSQPLFIPVADAGGGVKFHMAAANRWELDSTLQTPHLSLPRRLPRDSTAGFRRAAPAAHRRR
jgi:hypothetical protein